MKLRNAVAALAGIAALLVGLFASSAAHAAEVLKVGTLAPKASPWGQVFTVWEEAVKQKSEGRLELQFFYNGQQGDEGAMVRKMKAGQLDGAAVTAVGLSKIYNPVLALQLPGFLTSWAKLDAARDAMKSEFEKGIADAGFTLAGWSDVGQVRLMSKGFPVRSPQDLKGKKPFVWRDDEIQPIPYQVIDGVTPIPLSVPEVLPNLTTGSVNVVNAPALVAEQFQWAAHLDHIVDNVSAIAIGALVFSSKKLDALPADLKAIVLDTGKVAAATLTTRIRDEDAAAFARLRGKMTVVVLSGAETGQWTSVFRQVRQRLAALGTFSVELLSKLDRLAK